MTQPYRSLKRLWLAIPIALIFTILIPALIALGAEVGTDDQRISDMAGLGTNVGRALDAATAYNSSAQEYLLVWSGTEGDVLTNQDRLYGQRINARTGLEVGSNDYLVSEVAGTPDPDLDAQFPKVVYNSVANEYFVVFVGNPNPATTETEAYGQRLSGADGSRIGSAFPISLCGSAGDVLADVGTNIDTPIDVAFNATNNQYLVVFRCDDVGDNGAINSEFEIYGRLVNADGTVVGSNDVQISQIEGANGNSIYNAESPAVAWNSDLNEYLVVFGGDTAATGDGSREIYGQRLSAAGAQIGTNDFAISDTAVATRDSSTAEVAYNPVTNQYLVVWGGDRLVDNVVQVHGQFLTAAGAATGTNDFLIGSKTDSTNPQVEVIYNSVDDEFLVSWTRGTADDQMVVQRIDANGAALGTDDQVVSSMAFSVQGPSGLAYNSRANSYLLAWAGSDDQGGQVNNENEIFAQILSEPVDMQITKSVSLSQVLPGQQVTYTLNYTNAGPNRITDAVITDNVSALLTSVSCTVGAHTGSTPVLRPATTCTFDIDTLTSGQGGTITITGTLDPAATNGTVVNNTASISSATPHLDTNTANNTSANAPFTVIEPVLTMAKTITTATTGVDAGDTVRYQIQVSHDVTSTAGAFNVDLSDTLPAALQNLTLVSAIVSDGATSTNVSGNFSISGGTLSTVGALNLQINTNGSNDQALTVLVQGTVRDTAAPADVISNSAATTWENAVGLQKASYTDSASAPNITIPGVLNVTKSISAPGSLLRIGDTVTYQLSVGLVEGTTSNIQLVDTLPDGMSYVSGSSTITPNGMTVATVNVNRVGQVLTFSTASVTNPGNVNDAAAVDSDSLTISYQAVVTNVAGNQRGTTLTNDVDATATNVAADNNNQASATIVEPELTVAKTASDTSPNPGQTIDYTITLSHLGSSDSAAYDVRLLDTVPAGLTLNPASVTVTLLGGANGSTDSSAGSAIDVTIAEIPLGGSVEVSYQATVASLPAVSVGDVLTNSVAATWTSQAGVVSGERTGAGGVDDHSTTANRPVTVSGVDLSLTKSDGGASVAPGGTVAYTLSYANAGNQGATGVTLSETVPANTSFNAGASTAGWVCAPDNSAGSTCTLNVGAVAAAGNGSATFAVTVVSPVAAGVTQISNSASVADDGASGADLVPADNSASDTTPVNAAPDLSITKSDGGASVAPGGTIAYTLSYANAGNQGATGVALSETVPANTSFNAGASTAGWACAPDNSAGSTCTLSVGAVAGGGASGSATFAVTVNNPVAAGVTQISNSATVADDGANGADPTPANNSASDTTPVNAAPDLTLTKSDGGAIVTPGSTIAYTLSYANAGNQGATGVTLNETVPANTSFNPGASTAGWACAPDNSAGATCTLSIGALAASVGNSATFAVTVDNPVPGGVTQIGNSAAVADDGANGADPTPADNSASDTTPLDLPPTVTVEQAAGQADPTGVSPVNFTAVFNEPIAVASFTGADVTLGGTAGATTAVVSQIAPNDGTTFTIAVSGMANDGTVTASLAAGVLTDATGNNNLASTSTDNSVTYDANAPTVLSILRAGANPTNAASVSWTVTFSEDVSGVVAGNFSLVLGGGVSSATITSITGSGSTRTVTVSTGSGDGTLGLTMANSTGVSDVAANGVANLPFGGEVYTIDKTPPPAPVTSTPTNGSTTNDSTPAVSGTAEPNSTVTVIIDGGTAGTVSADASGNWSFTPGSALTDGSHTVRATATDAAGNTSVDSNTNTFVVDTLAPDTTITASPTDPTSSTSASFSFTGNDGSGSGVASFECRAVGLTPFLTCTSPASVAGPLPDGTYTFEVRAIDAAGNIDPTPASYTWTIDATAPDTTITASPPALSSSANASFSFSGNDGGGTGVASLACQIDGGGFVACTSPFSLIGLSDGPHTFDVRATDAAGNTDPTPASYTWTIDTTPPPAPVVTTPANGSATGDSTPAISGTAEPGSTVTVVIDGNPAGTVTADASGNWSFTPGSALAEGSHTARATATDAAGNTSVDSNTNTFTVDTINPTVTVEQDAGQADPSSTSPVLFVATFSEPVSGLSDADVSLGGTATTGAVTVSEIAPNDGTTYQISVVVTGDGTVVPSLADGAAADVAGNSSAASTSTDNSVLFDIAAPTVVSIVRAGASPTNAASVDFTVTFSEAVTGVAAGNFDLTVTGIAGASVTGVSGSGTTWTVTVDTGTGDGTLRLDMANSTGATDVASRALSNVPFTTGEIYEIDKTAPTVTIEQAAGQADPTGTSPILFTVTFSEAVTDFADADVSLTGAAGATTATVSEIAPNDGTTYAVSVSGMAQPGAVIATLSAGVASDAAGNTSAASNSSDNTVTFDPDAPVVTGIVRAGASPTGAATVDFTLTFSEIISGIDTGDFALATSGISGASVTSVSGSGSSYTVTVSTGTGSGTLRLDLIDDDSIIDTVGNPLGGAGAGNGSFTAGQVYTIDRAAPTASLTVGNIIAEGGADHTFTVVFSDGVALDVSTLDSSDIRVTGGLFNQLATFVSVDVNSDGTPRTATYRITAPGGAWDAADNGTYTVTLVAGQVSDTLGNVPPNTSLGSFTVAIANRIYLPLIGRPGRADLVVEAITASNGTLSVTIRNQGQVAVTEPFWVDLYINPSPAPTGVNQIWQLLGQYGAVWGVSGGALPIAPGQSLTLTTNGANYRADLSSLPASLPAGTRIFAQVDSASTLTTYGGVLESHEESGGAYNNISSITLSQATPLNRGRSGQPRQTPDAGMPGRPQPR